MADPTIAAKPAEGLQDTAIPLAIEAQAGSPGGSIAIRIGPLPQGAALTAGRADAVRMWSLTPAELAGLRFVPAPGASGAIALAVQADETSAAGPTTSASATLDIEVTAVSDEALRAKLKGAFVPAQRWQRWLTGILLILGSAVIVGLWFFSIDEAQNLAVKEYGVAWEQPPGTVLASGGASFWYDRANKILRHRGAIDAERKHELLGLLSLAPVPPKQEEDNAPTGETQNAGAQGPGQEEAEAPEPAPEPEDSDDPSTGEPARAPAQSGTPGAETQGAAEEDQSPAPPAATSETPEAAAAGDAVDDECILGYRAAIDALTYHSLGDAGRYFMLLLVVAGLSGAVGVQVRATINFVRIACFHNLLDVRRWWPWHLLRPPLGFILGVLIVLLVQSEIFTPEGASTPAGTAWWIAIAFLVGFGAEDFSERLRLLSQTLFGKGS